ncbi:glycosyltransferase family 39 protein [Gimesia sp.]|uniref:ArnT family glycosyltransferase n=1 Tax=Gimesia sp. TaxID=2024833 RepID=UPI000C542E26|nr:glycosyltransferase family 39 protein [Gimesia sp.]MAX35584.1 hypothetical protein [Gimesia sp.]HAH45774.1 hypothetical protein [Planctomycetaceae bacterium]HBL44216.1 hypothetical protein [Planctomycetaceae bacterium]|tara:strand:- start:6198 stop:7949 length:1752 start_codon:yes stop_codon:yes gene_type:complete
MASLQKVIQRPPVFWSVVGFLLLIQFCLGVYSARQLSVTHDEYWHLPVGFLSLETSRFDYDRLNPPLIRSWSALPLLMTSAQSGSPDLSSDPADYGDAFLDANPVDYQHFYFLGRCMILLLAVASGLLLALWTRELFSSQAACFAVFLWAMSPNILASAALGTQDLAITGFFLAALYCGWKFACLPSWKWAIVTGVVLGLAQLTKYTAILLAPLLVIQWILVRYKNPEIRERQAKKTLAMYWGILVFSCLFILNAGYLFQSTFQPVSSYQFQSSELKFLTALPEVLQSFPLPVPRDYIMGFDLQRFIMQQSHPTFLDNQWEQHGFRSYYLYTLLYKLPHGFQFLIVIALYSWLKNPRLLPRRTLAVLLTPVVLLLTIASLANNQLGLRYVLPIFPFLILLCAPLVEQLDFERRKILSYLVTIAILSLPLSLRYAPDHLAYFNELAGGPELGDTHLVDSNIDWGQDLYRLQEYLEEHPVEDLRLAYFGTIPPGKLGIKYEFPAEFRPVPGKYAISASILQGRPYTLRRQDGSRYNLQHDALGFFRFFEPEAQLGYSINYYDLTPEDIARWRTAVMQANRSLQSP